MVDWITIDVFKACFPLCKFKHEDLFPFLTAAMDEKEINTPERIAAFWSQIAHESGELNYWVELGSDDSFKKYDGRMGNGPGEGAKYRGRGPFQLTGKNNYKKYGDLLGVDLINSPELAGRAENGFRIAALYWDLNKLNDLADWYWFDKITQAINGGQNGADARRKYYVKFLPIITAAQDQ